VGVDEDDIISFKMTCKFSYKNCEVTVKRFGKILDLTILNISNKGYIIEKNSTFICELGYNHLINYLNENIGYIEEIHSEIMKKGFLNDNKIMDFKI